LGIPIHKEMRKAATSERERKGEWSGLGKEVKNRRE